MISEIIIHCSATRPDWMAGKSLQAKVGEIRKWHKERGFNDIGYHWIIDRDGQVASGRPEGQAGAHTAGRNTGTIGICLIGGFGSNATDPFSANYTSEQDDALRSLIEAIQERHPTATKVSGHNDYAPKACPGFKVGEWYDYKTPRRLATTRTIIGQTAAATGTVAAAAIEAIAPMVTESAQQVQPLLAYSDTLKIVFVVLTLAGIALTVYARLDDWRRGKR